MRWIWRLLQRVAPPTHPPTVIVPPQSLLPEIRAVHRRLDDLITRLEEYDQALNRAPRLDVAGDERTPDADQTR